MCGVWRGAQLIPKVSWGSNEDLSIEALPLNILMIDLIEASARAEDR